MARKPKTTETTTVNPTVAVEFNTVSKIALNGYTAKAREMGDTMSDGGVQMTIAIMGFLGSQKATKAKEKWDFNANVFCPFAERYYGPGKGGKREKLEGFKAEKDGSHTKSSSAATQLRAYLKFVTAGALGIDVKPAVLAVLSDQRIGSLSLGAKGKLLEDIIAKSPGVVPSDDIIATMVDAAVPKNSKTVDAVKLIKGIVSAADRVAKEDKFWKALTKLNNPKASAALAHAMHFLALARKAVDTTKSATDKNVLLNGFIEKNAAAEYKLAIKTGTVVQ